MIRRRSSRPVLHTVCNRLLLGAVLLLAILVAPLQPGLLPGPAERLASESQAHAQNRSPFVVDGEPLDCDAGWTPDGNLCRFHGPACPSSPYNDIRRARGEAPQQMQASTDFTETSYPEFCEERVNDSDLEMYNHCVSLTGFAVIRAGTECWTLQLRTCEVGLQVSLDWCRAETRRSWTCPDDTIPRNEFPTCYVVQTTAPPSQVCAGGAPELRLVSCEDYIGTDFIDSVMCDVYGNGFVWEMSAVSNNYWCAYNASFFDTACHSPPPCAVSPAVCLKRASGTGGCDGIARAVLCRNQQSDYLAQAEPVLANSDPPQSDLLDLAQTADAMRSQGCEPCQALPFEPIPDHCPDDLTDDPAYNTLFRTQRSSIHRQIIESEQDSPADVPCGRPPTGIPAWTSTHSSGVAVVNSPVVVQVRGVPVGFRPAPPPKYGESDGLNVFRDLIELDRLRSWAVSPGVAGTPSDSSLLRTYQIRDPGDDFSGAHDLGNESWDCVVEGLPAFTLFVEELWPDKDEGAIRSLFGTVSLDWWDAMSEDEQHRRTEHRGLGYWPDLTAEARRLRNEALSTHVECNAEQGEAAWCTWTPRRSGYFRLKVGGAWIVHAREDRSWKSASQLRQLRRTVRNLDDAGRSRVRANLATLGWGPEALGLNNALTDILPTGPDDTLTDDIDNDVLERNPDHLYWLPGDQHRFGGWDLRVRFTESRVFAQGAMYTETQTFGIQVHEVRVRTVASSR